MIVAAILLLACTQFSWCIASSWIQARKNVVFTATANVLVIPAITSPFWNYSQPKCSIVSGMKKTFNWFGYRYRWCQNSSESFCWASVSQIVIYWLENGCVINRELIVSQEENKWRRIEWEFFLIIFHSLKHHSRVLD